MEIEAFTKGGRDKGVHNLPTRENHENSYKAERWPPVNERCGQSLLNGSFQLWELKMLWR